ncbi:MAG TPA: hypothetical protein PL128_08550 [Ginsengibacter sp.]|nr:hypothetical protein [Ginsengibacter sp.]
MSICTDSDKIIELNIENRFHVIEIGFFYPSHAGASVSNVPYEKPVFLFWRKRLACAFHKISFSGASVSFVPSTKSPFLAQASRLCLPKNQYLFEIKDSASETLAL